MNPQDPLAQLRDIHLPEPVSWWPPAPGWWLLAVLVLIALVAISVFFYKRYQHNSFRRQALQLLENHFLDWQHNQDTSLYLQQVCLFRFRATRETNRIRNKQMRDL